MTKKLIALIPMVLIIVSAFRQLIENFDFEPTHRLFSIFQLTEFFLETIDWPKISEADKSTCMEGYIGNGWMCSIPDS